LGSEEAPARAPDAVPDTVVAGPQYAQRGPRQPPPAPEEPAPTSVGAPGGAPGADGPSEPGVAGRLQRAVQDRGWPVLLSPDGDRSFQPCAVGVSGTPLGEDLARAPGV